MEDILSKITPPDFDYSCAQNERLHYIHRKTPDADFYFVANNDESKEVEAVVRFRISGKCPELWDPATRTIIKPAVYNEKDGILEMPLHLDPAGSVFVVFRELANPSAIVSVVQDSTQGLVLHEPWDVAFPPGKQAPSHISLAKLMSWTASDDDGVKYFSGTATYTTTFDWSPPRSVKEAVMLDLGEVKDIAEVKLNGIALGLLWKPPYIVNISQAVKNGVNELEIQVTNLWPNRLIGDEKLHPDPSLVYGPKSPAWAGGDIQSIPEWVKNGGTSPIGRTTFVTFRFYDADSPLLPSGLLGPVVIYPK